MWHSQRCFIGSAHNKKVALGECVIAARLCNNRIVCAEISKESIQLKQIDFKWFLIDECPNSCACVVWQLSLPSNFNVSLLVCRSLMYISKFRWFNHFVLQIVGPHRRFIGITNHYIFIYWLTDRAGDSLLVTSGAALRRIFSKKNRRVCSFRVFHTTDYWYCWIHDFKVSLAKEF